MAYKRIVNRQRWILRFRGLPLAVTIVDSCIRRANSSCSIKGGPEAPLALTSLFPERTEMCAHSDFKCITSVGIKI